MLNLLLSKFKEVAISCNTNKYFSNYIKPYCSHHRTRYVYKIFNWSTTVILGLGIFLFGAEIGITPIGNLMGENLARSNRAWVVGILGFLLGFLITIAEPDLQILAYQVRDASGGYFLHIPY